MARTIAALFGNRANAEGALQALVNAGFAGYQSAHILREEARSTEMAPERTVRPGGIAGHGAALRWLRLPETDAAEFEEALRNGGCLLSARIEMNNVDQAIAILETFEPLDLDATLKGARRNQPGAGAGADAGAPLGAGLAAGAGPGTTNTAALPGMAGMAQSTHDVGSSDLDTRELGRSDRGSSTMATGEMRSEERAGTPGTMELARRDTTRSGRVRAYIH